MFCHLMWKNTPLGNVHHRLSKLLNKYCMRLSKCQNFAISTFTRVKEMGSGLLLMMILVLGPKVHLITERLKQKKMCVLTHTLLLMRVKLFPMSFHLSKRLNDHSSGFPRSSLLKVVILFYYRKVVSSNRSRLEAHAAFFRLLMKGIFDSYVL